MLLDFWPRLAVKSENAVILGNERVAFGVKGNLFEEVVIGKALAFFIYCPGFAIIKCDAIRRDNIDLTLRGNGYIFHKAHIVTCAKFAGVRCVPFPVRVMTDAFIMSDPATTFTFT